MSFLMKLFISNYFCQYRLVQKKLNSGVEILTSKRGKPCHFPCVLGPVFLEIQKNFLLDILKILKNEWFIQQSISIKVQSTARTSPNHMCWKVKNPIICFLNISHVGFEI